MSFEHNDFSLFRDFQEPVLIIDLFGTILDANADFANRFFGTVSEIRGSNLFDLVDRVRHAPELSDKLKKTTRAVLSAGKALVFEVRSCGKGLKSLVYPVKSANGDISSVLILVHDEVQRSKNIPRVHLIEAGVKTLLDAIPGAVFILDEDGVLLGCSEDACAFFGDSMNQPEGDGFFNLILHEDRQRVRNNLLALSDSESGMTAETRLSSIHDGRNDYRWFTLQARRRVIAGRRCLVVVCVDAERCKLDEARLEQYDRWFGIIKEEAGTGVWEWNVKDDGSLCSNGSWVSSALEKTAGMNHAFEVWEKSIYPVDRELAVGRVKKKIQEKADLDIEYRTLYPDGSVRWTRLTAKPVFDSNGEVMRYYGATIDMSGQKKVAGKIETTRVHLDCALEKCHIGWWEMNLDNYTTVRTIEHARIFGYETLDDQWSFERFLSQVVDDDRARVRKIITDSIETKRDFAFECKITRPDDDIRWIWSSGTLQFDAHGNATHVLGIVQDITERKRVEKDQERLQHLLQHSQKMEMVGQLAGGIAHDFNNSLTSILGNLEMLSSRIENDSPMIDYIKEIEKSAQHSAQLTRQLLMFAQKQLRSPKEVFLNREINKLVPVLRNLLNLDVQILWHPYPYEVSVEIDPAELEQLMINVVLNAGDSITGKGMIIIETGVVNLDSSNCLVGYPCQTFSNHAKISVTDTGSGIEKKTLPHIFEPFFTTKSVDKGAGLGLTTVYGILRQNKGCIDCKTEVGKGTTFTVYLPLYDDRTRQKRGVRNARPSGSSSQTVLIVEDDPYVLKILGTLLQTNGFNVFSSPDAETALETAQEYSGSIALLVTDIVLPKMNGVELSERFRELYPDIKTLFMSGYPLSVLPKHDRISEGVNFIEKPFGIAEFKEIVDALIYSDNHGNPVSRVN